MEIHFTWWQLSLFITYLLGISLTHWIFNIYWGKSNPYFKPSPQSDKTIKVVLVVIWLTTPIWLGLGVMRLVGLALKRLVVTKRK